MARTPKAKTPPAPAPRRGRAPKSAEAAPPAPPAAEEPIVMDEPEDVPAPAEEAPRAKRGRKPKAKLEAEEPALPLEPAMDDQPAEASPALDEADTTATSDMPAEGTALTGAAPAAPEEPPAAAEPSAQPAARWDRTSDTVEFDWPAIERTATVEGPNQAMAKLLVAARAEGANSRWPL